MSLILGVDASKGSNQKGLCILGIMTKSFLWFLLD
jgi:hypothetical protein